MTKSDIRRAVTSKIERLEQRSEVTQAQVLREIGRLAFADIRRLFDIKTGQLKPVTELSDDVAATLVSIDIARQTVTRRVSGNVETEIREQVIRVRQADKIGALTLAAKHLGMLRAVVQVESLEDLIARSRLPQIGEVAREST